MIREELDSSLIFLIVVEMLVKVVNRVLKKGALNTESLVHVHLPNALVLAIQKALGNVQNASGVCLINNYEGSCWCVIARAV